MGVKVSPRMLARPLLAPGDAQQGRGAVRGRCPGPKESKRASPGGAQARRGGGGAARSVSLQA